MGIYQNTTDKHIVFNNVSLDPAKKYFVYAASEYGSSQPIPQHLTGYDPIFICCVNPKYAPDNFIYLEKRERDPGPRTTAHLSDADFFKSTPFYEIILKSQKIQNLFTQLADKQGELYVKTFRNDSSFAPQFQNPRIKCFGLTPEQSDKLNDKTYQYQFLKDAVPVPNHLIVPAKDAVANFTQVASPYGVFVAGAYGSSGSTTFIAKTPTELEEKLKLKEFLPDNNIVLAECLKLKASVSLDILIANPNEVYPYGIFDQLFNPQNPQEYVGNRYPSLLTTQERSDITEIGRVVGKMLAEQGVRGYVSIDVNEDEQDRIFFGEINARYAGSTAERFLLMELTRPSKHPTIMDLEKMAIEYGTLNRFKLWDEPQGIVLKRKEYLAEQDATITNLGPWSIPAEQQIFQNRTAGIIGNAPAGRRLKHNTIIGKMVSVSDSVEKCDSQAQEIEKQFLRSVRY